MKLSITSKKKEPKLKKVRRSSKKNINAIVDNDAILEEELKAKEKKPKKISKKQIKKAKKQEQEKENKKKAALNKSTQNQIKYIAMREDGICQIDKRHYSKTYAFDDINYSIAARDAQATAFMLYMNVINTLDESIHVQITLNNKYINIENFSETMLYPLKGDKVDKYRREINDLMLEKATSGANRIIRERYITFTVEASSLDAAKKELTSIDTQMTQLFVKIGSRLHEQDGLARLNYLHQFMRPSERFFFEYRDLVESQLTTKDYIAPTHISNTNSSYLKVDDLYFQTLYLEDYPYKINDEFIKDLTELSFDITVNIHFQAFEKNYARKKVTGTISAMNQTLVKNRKQAVKDNLIGLEDESYGSIENISDREQVQELYDQMDRNDQKMYATTLIVTVKSPSLEELTTRLKDIDIISKKHSVGFKKLPFEQLDAFNTCLPIGFNHLKHARALISNNLATLTPFSAVELLEPSGIYYGTNAVSSNMIIYSRRNLSNGNGLILGMPGYGKSMIAKHEMSNVFFQYTNDTIFYIDPEGEGDALINEYGGQVISLSETSKHCINPMDISINYSGNTEEIEDPVKFKCQFIISMLDLILGGKNGLNKTQETVIDRACKSCYAPLIAGKTNEMPTLKDLHTALSMQPEDEAKRLAVDLEIYVDGSYNMFNGKTNVDLNNRFISFNIKDLPVGLKTMGMLIVLDQIWNKMASNREAKKRTWIYIDEIYLLFQNEYSSEYLMKLWKRARKWGGIPTGITQNVEDLLQSSHAKTLFDTSNTIILMKQSPNDREELGSILNLSDVQISYVATAEPGQGVMIVDGKVIPFTNKIPSKTDYYKIMTTNPNDK